MVCLLVFSSSQTLVKAIETPSWGVDRIGARCVWDKDMNMSCDPDANAGQYTGQNEDVYVAIIDTGVNASHPDLVDNIVGGICFEDNDPIWHVITSSSDYDDTNGHGTNVAGILAAADNEAAVIGVAPKVKIYVIKLAGEDGPTPYSMAAAINHAVWVGCQIISTSFGFIWPDNQGKLEASCRNAYGNNTLVIAAAGNENNYWKDQGITISYPAKFNWVIAVGATFDNDSRWVEGPATGSNYGPELDIMAPGYDINTTALNGRIELFSGTSAATPHVSGVLALMWAGRLDDDWDWFSGGTWNVDELEIKLETKALDLGQPWKDDEFGFGLVNAWRACQVPEGDLGDSFNVDLFDVVIVARAFGSQPNETEWNPVANINIDKYIDIFDIVIIALNFGKVDLP
jgi:subtilisin family serine protease